MIVEFEKPLRVYPIIIGCNNAVDKHIMVCSKPYTISTLKRCNKQLMIIQGSNVRKTRMLNAVRDSQINRVA